MSTHIHVILINTPVSLETLTGFFLQHNITPDVSSRGPTIVTGKQIGRAHV